MSSESIEDLIPQLDAVDESPGAAAARPRIDVSYQMIALARERVAAGRVPRR
jgi:hypothetical protein